MVSVTAMLVIVVWRCSLQGTDVYLPPSLYAQYIAMAQQLNCVGYEVMLVLTGRLCQCH